MGALIPHPHVLHRVSSEEDIGAVRRAVGRLALDDRAIADAMLIATELAGNVLHHAGGGCVLMRDLEPGIELIAIDSGEGIDQITLARLAQPAAVTEALPSFGGDRLGVGLGAVKRLASECDVYSRRGQGTVVLARVDGRTHVARHEPRRSPVTASWAGVNVPLAGNGPSGDAWFVAPGAQLVAVLVDGLGHGKAAAEASSAALTALATRPPADLEQLLELANRAMRHTRGGVIGACAIDTVADDLGFVGVGNITGRVLSGDARRSVVSHGGTLGVGDAVPRHRVFHYPWPAGGVLILASDGLRGRWDPGAYPALLEHHPAVIAAVLYRDFRRPNDDATVLVLKDQRAVGDDRQING